MNQANSRTLTCNKTVWWSNQLNKQTNEHLLSQSPKPVTCPAIVQIHSNSVKFKTCNPAMKQSRHTTVLATNCFISPSPKPTTQPWFSQVQKLQLNRLMIQPKQQMNIHQRNSTKSMFCNETTWQSNHFCKQTTMQCQVLDHFPSPEPLTCQTISPTHFNCCKFRTCNQNKSNQWDYIPSKLSFLFWFS